MDTWVMGGDPRAGPRPLHPSFEDRDGAPDRVFATLDDAAFERQVAFWSTALPAGGLGAASVFGLHGCQASRRRDSSRPDDPRPLGPLGLRRPRLRRIWDFACRDALLSRSSGQRGSGAHGGLPRASRGFLLPLAPCRTVVPR
jgi:hypothetical protein